MQRLSNPCGLEDTKKTQQLNLTQELVLDPVLQWKTAEI